VLLLEVTILVGLSDRSVRLIWLALVPQQNI
jgi:hypothetical protein